MASIEREVENALLNVVSGIGGVNFFTSERGTARTLPSVTVQAQIGSEELVPFSGVFKTPATITYVARADTTARADFDAKFYDILEQLYRDPDLASYLTSNSNITFYVAKVTGDTPAVISQNRTWSRAMTLDITATAINTFSPLRPSGLSLWLKADSGVTLSGSNVTAWADQSGNGNNAISPSISPTFVSSSINSKPAISFNGDGSWMQIPQNSIGTNGNISIFMVLNYTSGAVFFNKGDLETFEATAWELTTITGFGFVDTNDGDPFWNTVPLVLDSDTPLLLEGFSNDGESQLAFNGVDSGIPSDGCSGFNNISQYIGIGGGGTTGASQNNPLDARIAEIIIYNRQVTTAERQQVEAYINYKYAIY
jgi:hypothetical protein